MKGIQKMNAAVEKVLNIMVAVSFTILIAACVLQVFTRFVLNNSLSWTEELARYAFIWSNLLGAAICTQKSSHATVTAITDAESDAALLSRIRERVQRPPTSGNGYQYRQWALEVAGVGSAKVVELPGGPGTVGVTLVDSNGRAPSEEIVEAVEAHIGEERPVGAAVTVAAATEREVTVAAQVSLTGGAGAGAVQDAFRAALAGYLHTLIEGKYGTVYYKPADDQPYTLLYNRVLALLLNVDGVENFASLTVNGGTADVTIQAGEIPVLGEVSVT